MNDQNNDEYSLILLGNGFDRSLNQPTTYKDYTNWVKDEYIKNTVKSYEKKQIIKKSYEFIEEFEKWKQINKVNEKELLWSDLETDLLTFFNEKHNDLINKSKIPNTKKLKIKRTDWEKLIYSYSRFCFLMQTYYLIIVNKIKDKKTKDSIIKKIKLFDSNEIAGNNKVISVISLNYTFPYEFVNKKDDFQNKTKVSNKIYLLHYTVFTNNLFDFSWSLLNNLNTGTFLKKFKKFGKVNEFTNLSCGFINSDNRGKISNPVTKTSFKPSKEMNLNQIIEDLKLKINNKLNLIEDNKLENIKQIISEINVQEFIEENEQDWTKYNVTLIPEHHFFQSLILGNESVTNEKLLFLSKSKGDFLCVENYPKTILNLIENKIEDLKVQTGFIDIFGYSFGTADVTVNEWLLNKLKNGWKINLCFWEEQKDYPCVKETEENFKKMFPNFSYQKKFW
ncbi:hypothetical protein [Spiroplasma endosymbiont of Thecophora atra]|uniref:hypothetical protein n=2 Tax=unclassified Spiroplasma TaxID=2637901 RepID=UPI0030D3B81E